MFVEGFKEGLRYAGSIAERTAGVNAYKRWQIHAQRDFKSTDEAYQNRKGVGVFVGLIQIAMPASTESIAKSWSRSQFGTGEETNMNIFVQWAKYSSVSMIDGVSWMLMGTTDNLLQFALYKVVANAATHVALDLGGAAINRIKTFRPSATTLAV